MSGSRVAVFGLGYVGLPLIRACMTAGHTVVGMDVNAAVVDGLRAGTSHVDDVGNDEVSRWLLQGFHPTTDPSELKDIDVFVVCVPTPLTKAGGPDLAAVEAATRTIRHHIGPGALVVLESTTYPGTTEEVVRPILEESGLVAGEDFALSFSPERIDPGNPDFRFENTPKVVGGLTEACRDRACDFYGGLVAEVVPVKGLKEAEMAKLLENTYRHVNIALVNELARISNAMGIDIWEVIRAAETKPYGFQAFRPGPGVGGHCIPIDPNYLSHRVRSELGRTFRFVELAQEINAGMAHYVVERVQELLNGDGIAVRGARIIVLGVSYKADIADVRESPAIPIVRELVRMGAVVAFHDPYVDSLVVDGGGIERLAILSDALAGSNCALLLQDHAAYLVEGALDAAPLVLDTRGRTAFTRL
jgi:nucleotide sugar dehydrogenase